jgi:hypothetical protein
MGKVPFSLGRRADKADAAPQEEPSHVDDCKRLLIWDRPAMG